MTARILSLLIASIITATATAVPDRGPKPPPGPSVAFSGEQISINGVNFNVPFAPNDLIKVLGPPDREAKLVNTILTWDELGIHAYVSPTTQKLRSIQISMKPGSDGISPKKAYAGKLTVDGVEVTIDSTIAALNQRTKGNAFAKVAGASDWWRSTNARSSIFIGTMENGVGIRYLAIDTNKDPE